MDRTRRIAKRIAAAVWRGIRRWPKRTFVVVAPVVLLVVPVWPFFPRCVDESHNYRHIYRYMSDDYRALLKGNFRHFGVYYWDIGGIVFIRALPFLDGKPLFDHDDGIANAEMKAALRLSYDYVAPDTGGFELNGRIYRRPPFIGKLIAEHSTGKPTDWPHERCDVMPYIVTMTPPPKAER
jgi:hypothetical protein